MKIWIANPFDNLPQEGMRPQRYWLMARAFAAAGHSVLYWSADFSHALKRPRSGIGEASEHEGIALRLVHEPEYPGNVCLQRLWSHWRFSGNWLKAALEESKSNGAPDALIVSSPPISLAAAARNLCRKTGTALVVDVQDLWPETFERVAPAILLAPLKKIAKQNYLSADAVTAVANTYLRAVRGYGAQCPMHMCRLGIDVPPGKCAARGKEPLGGDATFRLAYIGNMSLSYDLATVIDAVKRMQEVSLELAGSGPDEQSLRRRAADCARIRFRGYLPETELREMLLEADAGVVPMFDDSLVAVPGKMGDYAAASLPVICSLGGEAAELLAARGAGVKYEAGNVESFAAAVAAVRGIGKAGAAGLACEFDAKKIYPEYCAFVERIVREKEANKGN